jgi:hypothetical protein
MRENVWYSPDGEPINFEEYIQFSEKNKIVKQEDVNNLWVSTVYEGLNHQLGEGPPLIFETMVFGKDGEEVEFSNEKYCERYSTLADAMAGHNQAVEQVKNGDIS